MSTAILLLSDLSHALGIIGHAEWLERFEVAEWLLNDDSKNPDPRCSAIEQDSSVGLSGAASSPDPARAPFESTGPNEPDALQHVALGRWYFTLGDADCAPSVPHGHERSKTQPWPKLNPYTGRVFSQIHTEDKSRRLTRDEMRELWRDEKFVDFCRKQVQWYASRFPEYPFPFARRGPLSFPRW